MKQKQTTLKAFLSLSSSSQSEEESEYTPSPKKSALKLPEMWTRVVSRYQTTHQRITVFDIEKDIETDKVHKQIRAGSFRENDAFLFDPDEWKGRDDELKFDRHRLSEAKLREYATLATGIRQRFTDRANNANKADMAVGNGEKQGIQSLPAPLKRSYLPI